MSSIAHLKVTCAPPTTVPRVADQQIVLLTNDGIQIIDC